MFNRQNERKMKNIQGRTFVKGGWMEVSVLATSLGEVHRKQYQKCNSCQTNTHSCNDRTPTDAQCMRVFTTSQLTLHDDIALVTNIVTNITTNITID